VKQKIGAALGDADGGVRPRVDHVELGETGIEDVVFHPVDDPTVSLSDGACPHSGGRIVERDNVVRARVGFGAGDTEVKVVVFGERREVASLLFLVHEGFEYAGEFPVLLEDNAGAQIAPAEFLSHDAERHHVGAAPAPLLGQPQRSQPDLAGFFEHFNGVSIFWVGPPIHLGRHGANFLCGELVSHPLERYLLFGQGEIQSV
jgi:hypothetical protein